MVHDGLKEAGAMKDLDVRRAMRSHELAQHFADPDTKVVDELGILHGAARVDVAVINGAIHGFEIKSSADTLERLARQVRLYSEVLDLMTLVAPDAHLEAARRVLPRCWGLLRVEVLDDGGLGFEPLRPATPNPKIRPASVAALLWRAEAEALLQAYGEDEGVNAVPRSVLYDRLANVLPLDLLRFHVRECLKTRETWRAE